MGDPRQSVDIFMDLLNSESWELKVEKPQKDTFAGDTKAIRVHRAEEQKKDSYIEKDLQGFAGEL